MRHSKTCTGRGGPLLEFSTKSAALNYIFEAGKENTTAYKCSVCDQYHLSPKSRSTPNTKCLSCGKDLYADKTTAERRAFIIGKDKGMPLSTYPCPQGNGWHLTKG